MRILYKLLPVNLDHPEHFIGPVQYSPVDNNPKSIQIKHQRYKIIQEAKRTRLNIHFNACIIQIQAYDQEYQDVFKQLESQTMYNDNRTTTNEDNNHISPNLWHRIQDYLTNRTTRLKEDIYHRIVSSSLSRMKLVKNRHRVSSSKTTIGVSPEPYLDLLPNPLNTCQWNYLSLDPPYIRSNRTVTHTCQQQEKEIEQLHKDILEKVKGHLVQGG